MVIFLGDDHALFHDCHTTTFCANQMEIDMHKQKTDHVEFVGFIYIARAKGV